MPMYDIICKACGKTEDHICPTDERYTCPRCKGSAYAPIQPVTTIGIVWSNAETNTQLGTHWETNAQKREWMKKHPKAQPMAKGSQADKDFSNQLKDKGEKALKKAGYKDMQEYQSEGRKFGKKAEKGKTFYHEAGKGVKYF